MILPSKHLPPHLSLLAVGALILRRLHTEMTVSHLWNDVRRRQVEQYGEAIGFDWFVLALDLLYSIGAVEERDGFLRRVAP